MLALCLMLSETYYAQNYAGIIGLGLVQGADIRQLAIKCTNEQNIIMHMILFTVAPHWYSQLQVASNPLKWMNKVHNSYM